MERLGIVDELQARTESAVAHLSPAARHQAFPTKYARPMPRDPATIGDQSPKLKAQIDKLSDENDRQAREIQDLRAENKQLRALLGARGDRVNARREPTMETVMETFCVAMNENGMQIGDEAWSILVLRSKRRTHTISHPRHVCLWLIRTLCAKPSLPAIGRAFGGLDHTTVMHGVRHAPSILSKRPELLKVATSVLSTFGVVLAKLEEGGRP